MTIEDLKDAVCDLVSIAEEYVDRKYFEELDNKGVAIIDALDEFRELKEKATAKKPIYSDFDENEDEEIIPYKAVCPVCGYEFEFGTWNDEQNHHCECGQRMLWN
jgi:hypothetical protein